MKFSRLNRIETWGRNLSHSIPRVGLIFCAVFLASATWISAVDLHVDGANGADVGGCGSPASPCATIQYAVNLAVSDDLVKVSEGTHLYPGSGIDPCADNGINDPAVLCVLNKEVTVSGGYTWPDWDSRRVGASTVIDAQGLRRAVLVMQTSEVAPAAGLTLEAFTVRNGKVEGRSSGDFNEISGYGGGLLADNSTAVLRGVVFENNEVHGGDTAQDIGGDAAGGGAMFRGTRAQANLQFVRFTGNLAQGGNGAVRGGYGLGGGFGACCGASVTGSNVTVDSNTARGGDSTGSGEEVSGARADGLGGGVLFGAASFGDGTGGCTAELSHSRVTNNLAEGGSGTIAGSYAFGGGIFAEGKTLDPTSVILRDSLISGNASRGGTSFKGGPAYGGGIAIAEASLVVERSIVTDNSAVGGEGGSGSGSEKGSAMGGGIHLQRLTEAAVALSLADSVVAGNLAQVGVNGDLFLGGGGGGLSVQGACSPELEHVTLAHNRLTSGMIGHAIVLIAWPSPPIVAVKNCVIADHTDPSGSSALHAQTGAVFNLDTGIFAGNFADHNQGGWQAGVFNGLATFLNFSAAGFAAGGSPAFDYHLVESSEAVDRGASGLSTVDFDGQNRGVIPDLGADELGLAPEIFTDGFDGGGAWAWFGHS